MSGGTLLHLALEFDDIDVARWLIERGADVNARAAIDAEGFEGHTPLFHTVVNLASGMGLDDDSKARLLLDHGADPNARATFPQEAKFHGKAPTEALHDVTPVGYARRHPDQRVVNAPALAAIIERGGRSDPAFVAALTTVSPFCPLTSQTIPPSVAKPTSPTDQPDLSKRSSASAVSRVSSWGMT